MFVDLDLSQYRLLVAACNMPSAIGNPALLARRAQALAWPVDLPPDGSASRRCRGLHPDPEGKNANTWGYGQYAASMAFVELRWRSTMGKGVAAFALLPWSIFAALLLDRRHQWNRAFDVVEDSRTNQHPGAAALLRDIP